MNENALYYTIIGFLVVGALWIGTYRDRRTENAIRTFAARHGLDFRRGVLLKGITPQASGEYKGFTVTIGMVDTKRFTKGIGHSEWESQIEARLDLPAGAAINQALIHDFLRQGGGYSGRALKLYFPKTWFVPLKFQQIEEAVARLLAAAQTLVNSANPGGLGTGEKESAPAAKLGRPDR